MLKKMSFLFLGVLLLAGAASNASAAAVNLNGLWQCDDGAVYYIRQIGNTVWWLGEDQTAVPPLFANVANGKIVAKKGTKQVVLKWADVPKGSTANNGTLVLEIVTDPATGLTVLQKIGGSAIFLGTLWIPIP